MEEPPKITNDAEADDAVQRAMLMMLDDIDGLDDPEAFNPILERARDIHIAAMDYYEATGQTEKVAEQASYVAEAENRMQDTDWIPEEIDRQKAIADTRHDVVETTEALNKLADLQPSQAIQHARRAFAKAQASGDQNVVLYEAQRLSRRFSEKGQEDEALEVLTDVARAFRAQGHWAQAAWAHKDIADYHREMNENIPPAASIAAYESAADLARRADDPDILVFTLADLLELYDEVGESEKFEAAVDDLIRLEPRVGPSAGMAAEDELRRWKRWKT